MKIKVECSTCNGTGQKTEWETPEKETDNELWLVEDCPGCSGLGKVEILVVDKRVKTKRMPLVEPSQY